MQYIGIYDIFGATIEIYPINTISGRISPRKGRKMLTVNNLVVKNHYLLNEHRSLVSNVEHKWFDFACSCTHKQEYHKLAFC